MQYRCEMCGASLVFEDKDTSVTCEYCRTTYPVAEFTQTAVTTAGTLLARGAICLEDGDFESAGRLYDRVLECSPYCAAAYIGKLLVELRLRNEAALAGHSRPLSSYAMFARALQYAAPEYKATLMGYLNGATQEKYQTACALMERYDKEAVQEAQRIFEMLGDFEDSPHKSQQCAEFIKSTLSAAEMERTYIRATELMTARNSGVLLQAKNMFDCLGAYKDAPHKAKECALRWQELKALEQHDVGLPVVALVGVVLFLVATIFFKVFF